MRLPRGTPHHAWAVRAVCSGIGGRGLDSASDGATISARSVTARAHQLTLFLLPWGFPTQRRLPRPHVILALVVLSQSLVVDALHGGVLPSPCRCTWLGARKQRPDRPQRTEGTISQALAESVMLGAAPSNTAVTCSFLREPRKDPQHRDKVHAHLLALSFTPPVVFHQSVHRTFRVAPTTLVQQTIRNQGSHHGWDARLRRTARDTARTSQLNGWA